MLSLLVLLTAACAYSQTLNSDVLVMKSIAPLVAPAVPSWNAGTDPCVDKWVGVECDLFTEEGVTSFHVTDIYLDLEGHDLHLDIDAFTPLTQLRSLNALTILHGSIYGTLPASWTKFPALTHVCITPIS